MRKTRLNKPAINEKGQALIIVVLLMLVSALVIAPMLSHVGTGLKTGKEVYEERMQLFYSADSGIEDGLWQIKSENLDTLFTSPAYDPYDFSQVYEYPASLDVNDNDVEVDIENIWIPKDIPVPDDPDEARLIIEGTEDTPPKLIITGSISSASTYQIGIFYYYDNGEDPGGATLNVNTIGIWLPPGFEYNGGCSLAGDPDTQPYATPTEEDYKSGKAVVWSFTSPVPLISFPGSNGYPLEKSFTFNFTGPSGQNPGSALSWVDTSGVDTIDYTWDGDVKVYKVTSTATDAVTGKETIVDAYTAKSEMRQMGTSRSGDYYAVGNSLIGGSGHPPDNYHYQLYDSTQALINTSDDPSSGIPADASIEAAYLYWSGWIDWHGYNPTTITLGQDPCEDWNAPPINWVHGSRWSLEGYWDIEFRGIGGGTGSANQLYFGSSVDLSSYDDEIVTVSWQQNDDGSMESDDYLYFGLYNGSWGTPMEAFQGDHTSPGIFSYVIPSDYLTSNFRLGFELDMNRSSDYIDIDDITITVGGGSLEYPDNPTSESIRTLVEDMARVNKVLFNNTLVTADDYQTLYPGDQFDGTAFEGTWFYTATADVTDLIDQWIDDGLIGNNGAGTYTLGHYYVGATPGDDDYRVNEEDPSYSFDFYGSSGRTGYPLGTPSPSSYPSFSGGNRYTAAHCGWSLLTIYSSPETKGHQLYLYDIQSPNFDFFFGWQNNADFDNDGNPGGTISGFLVPDPDVGSPLAGRITVFVGEGDAGYDYDYFRVNGSSMSNSASPANNVWNSNSPGMTVPGVDIDPFDITWSSGILEPGDTSVQIDIPTGTPPHDTDGFTMSYIILSFRSSITSGGTLSYLVRG
jgi:hypothetical protein